MWGVNKCLLLADCPSLKVILLRHCCQQSRLRYRFRCFPQVQPWIFSGRGGFLIKDNWYCSASYLRRKCGLTCGWWVCVKSDKCRWRARKFRWV